MRSLTLWLFTVGCLLVAAQAFQLPNIDEPEEDILDELAEDEDVDIARMLGDLFEDEEIDEDDDDDEEVTGRQLATVTGSEQDRYNTFMDTVLAQLKRQARDMEPLKFTLTRPKKNNKTRKMKQRKNKSKKDKKNDKKEYKDEKKNKRNSKDVELPEIRDIEEDLHQIQRRQAETEEEVTGRKAEEDDEEIDNEKRNKNRRKNRKNKNKNNKKQNNKKQRKSNNKVVLHGLSHIVREGDVKLYNMNKGKVIETEFFIGPIELDVTRKIDAEEHKAAASADKLKGKILIKVNKQGKARVKKLVLGRPKDITTTGSIARGEFGSGKGIFKKSVKQVSPTAAKKLLKAAREIIQTV